MLASPSRERKSIKAGEPTVPSQVLEEALHQAAADNNNNSNQMHEEEDAKVNEALPEVPVDEQPPAAEEPEKKLIEQPQPQPKQKEEAEEVKSQHLDQEDNVVDGEDKEEESSVSKSTSSSSSSEEKEEEDDPGAGSNEHSVGGASAAEPGLEPGGDAASLASQAVAESVVQRSMIQQEEEPDKKSNHSQQDVSVVSRPLSHFPKKVREEVVVQSKPAELPPDVVRHGAAGNDIDFALATRRERERKERELQDLKVAMELQANEEAKKVEEEYQASIRREREELQGLEAAQQLEADSKRQGAKARQASWADLQAMARIPAPEKPEQPQTEEERLFQELLRQQQEEEQRLARERQRQLEEDERLARQLMIEEEKGVKKKDQSQQHLDDDERLARQLFEEEKKALEQAQKLRAAHQRTQSMPKLDNAAMQEPVSQPIGGAKAPPALGRQVSEPLSGARGRPLNEFDQIQPGAAAVSVIAGSMADQVQGSNVQGSVRNLQQPVADEKKSKKQLEKEEKARKATEKERLKQETRAKKDAEKQQKKAEKERLKQEKKAKKEAKKLEKQKSNKQHDAEDFDNNALAVGAMQHPPAPTIVALGRPLSQDESKAQEVHRQLADLAAEEQKKLAQVTTPRQRGEIQEQYFHQKMFLLMQLPRDEQFHYHPDQRDIEVAERAKQRQQMQPPVRQAYDDDEEDEEEENGAPPALRQAPQFKAANEYEAADLALAQFLSGDARKKR